MENIKPKTLFEQAFGEWRHLLLTEKKKSHKARFLLACNNAYLDSSLKGLSMEQYIQASMKQVELKQSQKITSKAMKALKPVIGVLTDFYGIIDTFCSADPFPSAVIWGSLKIVIDGLGRYLDLFDKIRSQLHHLKFQLERMGWCEELWGHSEDMQRYLCSAYIQVFRFWSAVDKECERISLSALMRATTSFSTKKLQAIIDDLAGEVDKVDKLGPIVEARKERGEREDSERERQEAGLERIKAAEFRQKVLIEHDAAHEERLCNELSKWFEKRSANTRNVKRHRDNLDERFEGSCDWLQSAPCFRKWLDADGQDPILFLHALPGSGKSTLCSHAMANTQPQASKSLAPALAFQFFHFDEATTFRQFLYNIAAQLFDQYWLRYKKVPKDMRMNATEGADDLKNAKQLIHTLILGLPQVYIFLDGLDEEESSNERRRNALDILDFVVELTKLFPAKVRIWLSAQDRPIFRQRLEPYVIVNVQTEIRSSVQKYLSDSLLGHTLDLDEETRLWVLKELQTRSDGHFLYATLMIREITGFIPSIPHLKALIRERLPTDLNGYYKRMICRYRTGHERQYAAKILSVITFARRRLTMNQIIDAVWVTSGVENRNDPIFVNSLKKLSTALIVIDHDGEPSDDDPCQLFHSTVKDFLLRHPDILQEGQNQSDALLISEITIASACLSYLQQTKFEKLLRIRLLDDAHDQWLTSNGHDISESYLMCYASKYWDKHLDKVPETPSLRARVEEFLSSQNFKTTLQLQNLFVESHFEMYALRGVSRRHKFLKRVFPIWLTQIDKPGVRYARDYRNFISEWKYFLHANTCCTECRELSYPGEIDRCLFGALGDANFLSTNSGQQRSQSYMLANVEAPRSRMDKKLLTVDGVSRNGSVVSMARFCLTMMPTDTAVNLSLERWNIPIGDKPKLFMKEEPSVKIDDCHWFNYQHAIVSNHRICPVSFSNDLSILRFGSQLISIDQCGTYTKVLGASVENDSVPWYFEEFAACGQLVALASRQRPPKCPLTPDGLFDVEHLTTTKPEEDVDSEDSTATSASSILAGESGKNNAKSGKKLEAGENSKDKRRSSSDESTDELEPSDVATDSSASMELDSDEEDWSEGSTDLGDAGFPITDSGESSTSSNPSSVSSEEADDSTEDEHPHASGPGFLSDSDSGRYVGLDDTDNSEGEEYRRKIMKSGIPTGKITVFNVKVSPPKQLFQYSAKLPLLLYGSPPVFHPTKSLVVWPLCNGEILFADFIAKSYFIRKSSTTSRHTRHVFMKCNFSDDGSYLHIASLEAHPLPAPKTSKAEIREEEKATKAAAKKSPLLELSLFVTTHRLSQAKTTRSPPHQVHYVKIKIGNFATISVSQIPLTITWSPTHVYCTSSSRILRVFKIALFAPAVTCFGLQPDRCPLVTVPKNEILLPDSSRVREIYYYPPTDGEAKSRILIGSLNSKALRSMKEMLVYERDRGGHTEAIPDVTSPPIGLFVTEEELGGWISEEGREALLAGRRGRGGLERKVERFDAKDDCDIEPYISW